MSSSSEAVTIPFPIDQSAAKNSVEVRGQVRAPGEFPFVSNAVLQDYLFQAGGTTFRHGNGKVVLVREDNGKKRIFTYDLRHTDRFPPIISGDVLIVHGVTSDTPSVQESAPDVVPADFLVRQPETLHETKQLGAYVKLPKFRRVLNQVIAAQEQRGFVSLAVMSRHAGEGKSFFCSALAVGFAQYLDAHVLIIDTVNEPQHRTLFFEKLHPVAPKPLASRAPSQNGVLRPHTLKPRTHAGSIDFLSTRSFGDGDYEASDFQLGRFIRSLRSRYQLILVDTCALDEVQAHNIDPIIIAEQSDAALFLTSDYSLQRESLDYAIAELQDFRVQLIGAVFNRRRAK